MLLVSDANIFIDLEKIGVLHFFDKLDFTVATSDFVYTELNQRQQEIVSGLHIEVFEMDADELMHFYDEFMKQNLKKISYQDYSIFYYAKKYQGEVLSNDKRLRIYAAKKSIPVKGLFYILDVMISRNCVGKKEMIEKLLMLKEINKRLPLKEIEDRIEKLK